MTTLLMLHVTQELAMTVLMLYVVLHLLMSGIAMVQGMQCWMLPQVRSNIVVVCVVPDGIRRDGKTTGR